MWKVKLRYPVAAELVVSFTIDILLPMSWLDFFKVRLRYPGTAELADFWKLGFILVPLSWLIFGQ